ncbi:MAG TPA: glycosyltransferase [Gemmatimonadaceae bacterium]|jgi:hypothetical protein|nr:glycosyltransferase [Gemmatimonadaceae bacterium]
MRGDPNDVARRRADTVRGLVSVIIPAHDAEAWLAETIGSVATQTYPHTEVIVVDDASTDATRAIAARLGAIVVETRGAGPGGARNAGMKAARGEFLQFLDADDLLAPAKVARQVSALTASGADVAWEPFHHLAAEPNGEYAVRRRVVPELGPDLAASLLASEGFVQIGALLVRRTARTDAVWFRETAGAVEDVRYAVELALSGAVFVGTDTGEPGLLYRQHTGPRYSTRPMVSFARGCAENAAWAEQYWEQHGGLTAPRRAALGEAYAFAARQLAAHDPAAFDEVASRGLALGPEFLGRLPGRVRLLARVVGYQRAELIATSWRRIRRAGHARAR